MIEQKDGKDIYEYNYPGIIEDSDLASSSSNDFEILQAWGSGGFSQVLKVKSKKNKRIYAMKKIDMDAIKKEQNEKFYQNEKFIVQKLMQFNHPNICKYYKVFPEGNFLFFVMEFMNNGDLSNMQEANMQLDIQIPENYLWEIFYKSLSGLKFIHEIGLIHRDIKLANLFLNDDLDIKIGDFNISCATDLETAKKFLGEKEQEKAQNLINDNICAGSGYYQAPELTSGKYDQKIDVFSMGVAFFILCYNEIPYGEKYEKDMRESYYENKKYSYSKELIELIDKMIQKDPKDRITSKEAYDYTLKYFLKRSLSNSGVESAFSCLNQYPNVIEYFRNHVYRYYQNNSKKEIASSVDKIFKAFKNNDKENLGQELYSIRKIMKKVGFNIDKDSEEIDPRAFISFLLKILNSELSEVKEIGKCENDEYAMLGSAFSYPKGKEELFFSLYNHIYNKRLLSLISRNFFSIVKLTKICQVCKNENYYFSLYHFIPFNVEIFTKKSEKSENLSLMDSFKFLQNDEITLNMRKSVKCNKCNKITEHKELKSFYHTAKNLVIIFDRGEYDKNKTFINFDEQLYLTKKEVERYEGIQYILVGIIEKLDNGTDEEEYISFTKKEDNQWISNKSTDIYNFEDVKKKGTVVSLFYYCINNIILESPFLYNQEEYQEKFNQFKNERFEKKEGKVDETYMKKISMPLDTMPNSVPIQMPVPAPSQPVGVINAQLINQITGQILCNINCQIIGPNPPFSIVGRIENSTLQIPCNLQFLIYGYMPGDMDGFLPYQNIIVKGKIMSYIPQTIYQIQGQLKGQMPGQIQGQMDIQLPTQIYQWGNQFLPNPNPNPGYGGNNSPYVMPMQTPNQNVPFQPI